MNSNENEAGTRTIATEYSFRGNVVKVNRSANPNKAVATCILHMQINQYGATVAEVYDLETGELHAQIKRQTNGNITIAYKRDPMNYVLKGHLESFQAHMKRSK